MFEFFASLLPDSGYYCIALLNPKGGFRHRWFDDKQKAYDFAVNMDQQGETVYFAQGGFSDNTNRKTENVCSMRSFFLDIDCGEGKPFASQADGILALNRFCEQTSLPIPSVVNSGTGLYAYWRMDSDLPAQAWVISARLLKGLCEATDFRVDPVRTADRSSVLRPVGATNRKRGDRTVRAVHAAAPVTIREFATTLLAAAKQFKVSTKAFDAPQPQINAEFTLEMGSEKPSAYKIAENCPQIAQIRDTKGNVSEPFWYAAIGLLKHTIEAPEVIHEWSSGHPEYDRRATDAKIASHKVHASTCHYFHSVNPDTCVGCKHHNKINSPWKLGLADPVVVAVDDAVADVVDFPLPNGFQRTDKGLIYSDGEGSLFNVFPYDLYPVKLTQDETLGQEILCLRAKDPHAGWFDVQVRTALLHDPKALLMALADQGVHPHHGKTERALFVALLAGYMQQLKDNRRKMVLSQQMGWREEPDGSMSFVLGDRLISKRGIESIGVARQADAVVKSICKQGALDTWASATAILDVEGMEPWAFTLAALGFGSPLMKFTGYKGAMLSMVGKSGLGKTAMGWWSLSLWGNPDKLQMIQRDSHNATVARMALYNNLPLFIDEITNVEPKVLSDLAYQMTQGRDKHTLTRNRSERSALTWETIGAASSNKSLVDILGGYKSDPGAEINRIFEYEFPSEVPFDGVTAYRTVMKNFGTAGEVYAKYLVDHQDEHADMLLKFQKMVEHQAKCRPEERFWAIIAACALYGASIGKQLNLFQIDLGRLTRWVVKAINNMRGVKEETVVDSVAWLGAFVSKYSANMMVCRHMKDGMYQVIVPPRGPLYIRKDEDLGLIWVSRDLLKKELLAGSAGYSRIKKELTDIRALRHDSKRITLGNGTEYAGVSELCWEIDLMNPNVGTKYLQIVKEVESEHARV